MPPQKWLRHGASNSMPKDLDLTLLRKSIEVAAGMLGDSEAIIEIRMGRTRPGRQVFHYYKFEIAKPDSNLSGPPKDRRSLVVEINQDSPESAHVIDCPWMPWDQVYSN
jgi:hypothetical protein